MAISLPTIVWRHAHAIRAILRLCCTDTYRTALRLSWTFLGQWKPALKPSGLPELVELERLIDQGAAFINTRVLCHVAAGEQDFPVHVIALGNPDPAVPAAGFFGGVHGLERIGAQIVIAYLGSLVMRMQWDDVLHRQLESVRCSLHTLINPGGMWQGTSCQPQWR